jgi:hypothetical protein
MKVSAEIVWVHENGLRFQAQVSERGYVPMNLYSDVNPEKFARGDKVEIEIVRSSDRPVVARSERPRESSWTERRTA